MAFDTFVYFPGSESVVPGETQDDIMKQNKAFEIISFGLGCKNDINIGSISAGGGSSKATFEPFSFTKNTDSASCGLHANLCEGKHFPDCVIELRRSGGAAGASGATFLKFELKLVMVEEISWSGSDGADVCEENVVLQYGAIKITYFKQDKTGAMAEDSQSMFSRVTNKADFTVN
ncbi:MAG: type VI secretion system tube protein Hcp [Paracoccaceae bacterium]